MKIGDKVRVISGGDTHEGCIAEVFMHTMGVNEHTSIKVTVKNFMLSVVINVTLFPHRVWSID